MKIKYVWLDNGCCDENGMGIDVHISLSNGQSGTICLDSKKSDPLFARIIAGTAGSEAQTDGERVYWENGASLSMDYVLGALEPSPPDGATINSDGPTTLRKLVLTRNNPVHKREKKWREIKKETIELSEEKLEMVAGGSAGADIAGCHFEPFMPIQHEASGLTIRVRCKANCYIPTGVFTEKRCVCHSTDRCVGSMHTVEKRDGSAEVYIASPSNEYGHSGSGKLIYDLIIF